MKARLLGFVGWATVLIGLVHVASTFIDYSQFNFQALWFMGSGFSLLYTGALTLFARGEDVGDVLRSVAIGANVLGLGLGLAFCVLSQWTQPQGIALVALFAVGSLVLSLRRRDTSRAGVIS